LQPLIPFLRVKNLPLRQLPLNILLSVAPVVVAVQTKLVVAALVDLEQQLDLLLHLAHRLQ
jgi:hypothetical protein